MALWPAAFVFGLFALVQVVGGDERNALAFGDKDLYWIIFAACG